MRKARMISVFLFLCFFSVGAVAQETGDGAGEAEAGAAETENAKTEDKLKKTDNPYFSELEIKSEALDQTLSEPEKQRLVQLRDAFGMLRSMELVKKSVARAVQACGEENPDIRDEMTTRFDRWKSKVEPVQEKQEAKLEQVLGKPYFEKPGLVKEYLETVDKAAHYADKQYDVNPLSDEKSCQRLIESMDETEDKLVSLLGDLPWPEKPDSGASETPE